MFSNIPQQRLLLYIALLGLIPALGVLFYFMSGVSGVKKRLAKIFNTSSSWLPQREKKQAVNIAVRNNFRES